MADHNRSFQDTFVQLGGEDVLHDLTELMLNRIMSADVAQRINADRHERETALFPKSMRLEWN